MLKGKMFWDKSAPYFGRTENSKYIVYPALKKLCGTFKSKKILDIGCATGELSIDLANKGAKVVGLDYSEKMIEIAQKRAEKKEVKWAKFLVADAKNLEVLATEKFDIIIINVLLPHLETKREIERVLNGVRMRLKNDGQVLLAEPHPCFDYLLRKEIFSKDGETSYFHSGKPYEFRIVLEKSGEKLSSIAYHWTLEDYVSAISNSGLVIKNLYEPKPVKSLAKKSPKLYKRMTNYPTYIIFELGK